MLRTYALLCVAGAAKCVVHSRPAGMTVILVWIWGLRLTVNFLARGGVGHEDWRYTDQRAQFGASYWIVSIVTVFLAQSAFMCTGTLSLYPAILGSGSSDWSGVKFCGAVLTASAIVLEAVSDMQMDAFLLEASLPTTTRPPGCARGHLVRGSKQQGICGIRRRAHSAPSLYAAAFEAVC